MARRVDITVNLDKKCLKCGKGGATQNGLCLDCINKKLKAGDYNHIIDKVKRGGDLTNETDTDNSTRTATETKPKEETEVK